MKPSDYQEEWLSAYLDDELTEEQRQIVDERLADDPAALATLDDLKRVRKLVSQLAPWSGPALQVDTASLTLTGSQAIANDHSSFAEVPRSLSNEGELRGPPTELKNLNSKPRRFLIAMAVTAASILLLLGLSSRMLFQEVKQDLAMQASSPSSPANNMHVEGLELEMPDADRSAGSANDSRNSESGLEKMNDGLAGSELLNRQMEERSASPNSDFASPLEAESMGMRASGLERAELSAIEPSANFQDPQARGGSSNFQAKESLAETESFAANSNYFAIGSGNKSQLDTLADAAERIHIARSQAWSDEEVQSVYTEAMPALGFPSFGSTKELELGVTSSGTAENRRAGRSVSQPLVLASISPTSADTKLLFGELIAENQLTPITESHGTALSTPSASSSIPPANEKIVENTVASNGAESNVGKPVDKQSLGKNAPDTRSFQQSRNLASIPESIVLFLTQSEAEHVLEQLKQKGLMLSQVWRVTGEQDSDWRLPSSTTAAENLGLQGADQQEKIKPADVGTDGKQLSSPTPAEANQRKVILLLSRSPK